MRWLLGLVVIAGCNAVLGNAEITYTRADLPDSDVGIPDVGVPDGGPFFEGPDSTVLEDSGGDTGAIDDAGSD